MHVHWKALTALLYDVSELVEVLVNSPCRLINDLLNLFKEVWLFWFGISCESELTQLQRLLNPARIHEQLTSIYLRLDIRHNENLMEEFIKQVGVEDKMLSVLTIHQFVLSPSLSFLLENLKSVLNVRLQNRVIHR